MKKTIIFCLMVLLVFALSFSMPIHADILTTTVSIQDAINSANDGDTIFIPNGIYQENIVIDKPISLIGESKEGVILLQNFSENDTLTRFNSGWSPSCNLVINDIDVTQRNVPLKIDTIIINSENVTLENMTLNNTRGYRYDSLILNNAALGLNVRNVNLENSCQLFNVVNDSSIENVEYKQTDFSMSDAWNYRLNYIKSIVLSGNNNIIKNNKVPIDISGRNNTIENLDIDFIFKFPDELHVSYEVTTHFDSVFDSIIKSVKGRKITFINSHNNVFIGLDAIGFVLLNSKNNTFLNNTALSAVIEGINANIDKYQIPPITVKVLNKDVTAYLQITNTTAFIENNTVIVKIFYNKTLVESLNLANTLTIKFYNETSRKWQDINATINTDEGSLSAIVSHFSFYTLGEVGDEGIPQIYCGNGICEGIETCSSCSVDCACPAPSTGGGGGGGGYVPPKVKLNTTVQTFNESNATHTIIYYVMDCRKYECPESSVCEIVADNYVCVKTVEKEIIKEVPKIQEIATIPLYAYGIFTVLILAVVGMGGWIKWG